MLDTYQATRYVVPLREGGSMPAVLDTRDGGLFVVKFRGAGQGARALVAEILVGRIAQRLGLPVPEMALIELDESFGRSERDPEIQDILKGSRGTNVGHRFLDGAFNYDSASDTVDPELAARIVWLDALTTHLDRTARNPNLLLWQDQLWLIDHGAALYFHHGWNQSWQHDWEQTGGKRALDPFTAIADHVLLADAGDLARADRELAPKLTEELLDELVGELPDSLLMDAPVGAEPAFGTAFEHRSLYRRFLATRLEEPRPFVDQAVAAQAAVRATPKTSKSYRR